MRRLLLSLATVSLLAACGGGDGTTPPTGTPGITLAIGTASGTIALGASGTTTLTLGRVDGYADAVLLSAEGTPTGVTVTFAPQTLSGTTTSSTATISVGTTAPAGTSNITFRATGSGVTDKTVTYALTIPAPAITVSVGTGTASAVQGGTATVPVTITRTNGATGAVTLTAEGLPANVTAAFVPASIPDGSTTSTLTLTVGANATVATSPIVVRATSPGVTDQTATVQLTVTAGATPAYTITAAPAALSVVAGQAGSSTLTITKTGGFAANVTLGLEGAPAGVTGTFAPNPATGTTSTLTINTTAAVAAGVYNLTVRGAATGLTDRTITIALTVTAPPGLTLTLAPTTLSIAQGGSGQTALTLARLGGLTGDVALTATGAPAGITVAFAPATVVGAATSSTITVTVGAAVAAGTSSITVTGTGAGGIVGTATLSVTVTVASGFTLSATNVTVAQGNTVASTVTITRTGGYPGAVQLNATNVPPNINASFSPNPSAGGTSTLTLVAAVGAVVGTYTITVSGTGPNAADQSTTLTITVTASGGGGGNIAWQFCDPTRVPLWFAFRNGATGAWTQVLPGANNTFSFTLSGAVGSVTYVIPRTGGVTEGTIYLNTTAELQGMATSECTNNPGTPTKSLTGTFAGLTASQNSASVTVGGAAASTFFPIMSFSLTNVPDRVVDLMAVRSASSPPTFLPSPDRAVLRRNVNYAANSAIPVIDLAGAAESFALATATATVANAGSDQMIVEQGFQTSNGLRASLALSLGGSTVTTYGVPSARTQAGDLHSFIAIASNGDATSIRQFIQFNRELASRTYTLGGALNLPTVTTTATVPYARLRVAGAWQAEYPDAGASTMTQTSGKSWTVTGSRGFFGASAANYEFEIPDFSAVAGFQTVWGLVPGSPVTISTTFTSFVFGDGAVIGEGTSMKTASRTQVQMP